MKRNVLPGPVWDYRLIGGMDRFEQSGDKVYQLPVALVADVVPTYDDLIVGPHFEIHEASAESEIINGLCQFGYIVAEVLQSEHGALDASKMMVHFSLANPLCLQYSRARTDDKPPLGPKAWFVMGIRISRTS